METTQNEPQYCKTVGELAGFLEISRQEIQSKWMKKDGWPTKVRAGWDINACREFRAGEFRKLAERTSGVNSDAKSRYWNAHADKEIENALTAKVKRQKEEKEVYTFADVQELVGYFTSGLAKWISLVKVRTGNAQQVADAELIRDQTLGHMRGLIEQNTQKVKL